MTAEIAVLPSAPAEPKANVPTLHSSASEEPAEPTASVSSIEIRSDDNPEKANTQYCYIAHPNDNVSILESTLVSKATPETFASQPEEVATKTDAADDKETILPSVIDNSESPTIVASGRKAY